MFQYPNKKFHMSGELCYSDAVLDVGELSCVLTLCLPLFIDDAYT